MLFSNNVVNIQSNQIHISRQIETNLLDLKHQPELSLR